MSIVLKGGEVLGHGSADVLVEDGRISRIGPGLDAERVLDCTGAVVVPGFVDLHAHLREPGNEEAETVASGSAAAAAGGYVAIVAMPNTQPPADTASVVARVKAMGDAVGLCRVIPAGTISLGRHGEVLAPFGELAAEGVVLFTDDGTCVRHAGLMRRALEYALSVGGIVANHAEDADLCGSGVAHEGPVAARLGLPARPPEAEEIVVARDLALARATAGRLHIPHVSTAAAVDLIRDAKARGVAVTAEVTPHHLFFTEERLEDYDTVFRVNPPLREKGDLEALRAGLADGTIDAVATDHAPHTSADKEREFDLAPPGMIGLETAFAAVSTALDDFSLETLVERMSTAPARILGLGDEFGGALAEGRPAHLAVVEPDSEWVVRPSDLRSRSRNCPFVGERLRGRVRYTMYQGRVTHP